MMISDSNSIHSLFIIASLIDTAFPFFVFSGGALALNVGYFLFALVLTIFVIWKKLYKDTWYGMYPIISYL